MLPLTLGEWVARPIWDVQLTLDITMPSCLTICCTLVNARELPPGRKWQQALIYLGGPAGVSMAALRQLQRQIAAAKLHAAEGCLAGWSLSIGPACNALLLCTSAGRSFDGCLAALETC